MFPAVEFISLPCESVIVMFHPSSSQASMIPSLSLSMRYSHPIIKYHPAEPSPSSSMYSRIISVLGSLMKFSTFPASSQVPNEEAAIIPPIINMTIPTGIPIFPEMCIWRPPTAHREISGTKSLCSSAVCDDESN